MGRRANLVHGLGGALVPAQEPRNHLDSARLSCRLHRLVAVSRSARRGLVERGLRTSEHWPGGVQVHCYALGGGRLQFRNPYSAPSGRGRSSLGSRTRRAASSTACVRLAAPNLRSMAVMCAFTVFSVICSS